MEHAHAAAQASAKSAAVSQEKAVQNKTVQAKAVQAKRRSPRNLLRLPRRQSPLLHQSHRARPRTRLKSRSAEQARRKAQTCGQSDGEESCKARAAQGAATSRETGRETGQESIGKTNQAGRKSFQEALNSSRFKRLAIPPRCCRHAVSGLFIGQRADLCGV